MLYDQVLDTFGPVPSLLKAVRFDVDPSVVAAVKDRLRTGVASQERIQPPCFDITWWELGGGDLHPELSSHISRAACLIDLRFRIVSVFVSPRESPDIAFTLGWEAVLGNDGCKFLPATRFVRNVPEALLKMLAHDEMRIAAGTLINLCIQISNYLNDRPDEVSVEPCDRHGRRVVGSAGCALDSLIVYRKLTRNLAVRVEQPTVSRPGEVAGKMRLQNVSGHWWPRAENDPRRRWVRDYARGDDRNGIVVKDYALILDKTKHGGERCSRGDCHGPGP